MRDGGLGTVPHSEFQGSTEIIKSVDNPLVPPAAIIFDLDGTLLDHESAVESGLIALHAAHGPVLGLALPELRRRWRELLEQYFSLYLSGGCSFQDQRRLRIRELMAASSVRLTDEKVDSIFATYAEAYVVGCRTFPEVPDALARLGEFRLAVLTNGDGEQQRAKLAAAGLVNCFEAIFISSEIGVAKPNPAAFRHVAARMGVQESDCVFIGDNPEVDIHGAMQAGMFPILVMRRAEGAPSPDIVAVSNLLEAVALARIMAMERSKSAQR